MANVSYRQYLALLDWRDEQKNNPSLTDYYLMQVAREVFCSDIPSDRCTDIKVNDFKLKFGTAIDQPEELTEEEIKLKSQIAMGGWLSRIGFNPNAAKLRDE